MFMTGSLRVLTSYCAAKMPPPLLGRMTRFRLRGGRGAEDALDIHCRFGFVSTAGKTGIGPAPGTMVLGRFGGEAGVGLELGDVRGDDAAERPMMATRWPAPVNPFDDGMRPVSRTVLGRHGYLPSPAEISWQSACRRGGRRCDRSNRSRGQWPGVGEAAKARGRTVASSLLARAASFKPGHNEGGILEADRIASFPHGVELGSQTARNQLVSAFR